MEGTAWWCFSGVHMICTIIKWRSKELELVYKLLDLDEGVTRTGCGRTAGSGGDCCAALWVVQHSVHSCGAAAAEQEVLPLGPVLQSMNMGHTQNAILVMFNGCKARLVQHSVPCHGRAAAGQEVLQLPTSRCLPE